MPNERTTMNGFFTDSEWLHNRISWVRWGGKPCKAAISVAVLQQIRIVLQILRD